MKKNTIYIIIIYILTSSFYVQNHNNYLVINSYLTTIEKESNKEIIIIREKISNNETISIFRGCDATIVPMPKKEDLFEGVQPPLYNENQWLIMKNKYWELPEKNHLSDKYNWNKDDFKHRKIELIGYKECLDHFKHFNFPYGLEKKIYAFSEPIYYKDNKYVVFTVNNSSTKSIGLSSYIIIMKKIKNRWIVISKVSSYWYN
jgi:hypothetical protein